MFDAPAALAEVLLDASGGGAADGRDGVSTRLQEELAGEAS
jgi:hypothetical protein